MKNDLSLAEMSAWERQRAKKIKIISRVFTTQKMAGNFLESLVGQRIIADGRIEPSSNGGFYVVMSEIEESRKDEGLRYFMNHEVFAGVKS